MKISETHRYEVHAPDGKIAGAIYVRKYFNGKPTYIANLKVRKEYRYKRLGYGKKLVQMVVDKYGDDTLKLRYYSYDPKMLPNSELRKFYESFGFHGPKNKKTLVREANKCSMDSL